MWCTTNDHLLDENAARRIEEERKALCPEHSGTVLHVIPADIEVFDQEVLSFWMTKEASKGWWRVRPLCPQASPR